MHCCLHLCGQPVSVGRLDQLLIAYYKRDIEKGTLTPEQVIMIQIDSYVRCTWNGMYKLWIFTTNYALHVCDTVTMCEDKSTYYLMNLEFYVIQAQEIIDAFFIKFDEHVVLNRYNIPYGHTSYGSTAVTGRGGPFPTGDSMNQWIQQVN